MCTLLTVCFYRGHKCEPKLCQKQRTLAVRSKKQVCAPQTVKGYKGYIQTI